MSRLARRYWNDLPWDIMGNDDAFRTLQGVEVRQAAEAVLDEFDDIAVFVFFSVFEAAVRKHLWTEVEAEASALRHPVLRKTARRIQQGIEEGSFYRNVLDLYKEPEPDLAEKVNQIRRYRNWVARGQWRRGKPVNTAPRGRPGPGDGLPAVHRAPVHSAAVNGDLLIPRTRCAPLPPALDLRI